jgi:Zn-dependent peptidase ImmA (M78 family)
LHEFPTSKRLNWTELFNLKRRWGASVQAIIRRAYDLRLLDAVQYRNANVYISRNGWRHGEPFETEPDAEPIEILPAAFEKLRRDHGISPEDVAQSLNIHCSIINNWNSLR